MSDDSKKTISPDEAKDIFARQLEQFALSEEEEARAKKLGLDKIDLSYIGDILDDRTPFDEIDGLTLQENTEEGDHLLDTAGKRGGKLSKYAKKKKKKPSTSAVYEEDKDAKSYYPVFFRERKYEQSDVKRKQMAYTCSKALDIEITGSNPDSKNYGVVTDNAEKLMELDNRNIYNEDIEKHSEVYAKANRDNVFYGYMGDNLEKAREIKARYKKEPGIFDAPLINHLGLIVAAVAIIGIRFVPVATFEAIFDAIMKVVYTIIAIILILTAGIAGLFMMPFVMFGVGFVFEIIDFFINPFLRIKLLLMLLFGGIAYYCFKESGNLIKGKKREYNRKEDIRKELLPLAEKFLRLSKEKNLSQDIITYYERLVKEVGRL